MVLRGTRRGVGTMEEWRRGEKGVSEAQEGGERRVGGKGRRESEKKGKRREGEERGM